MAKDDMPDLIIKYLAALRSGNDTGEYATALHSNWAQYVQDLVKEKEYEKKL